MVASRAVNGAANVSPRAAARVHEAIAALGYVQHAGARAMALNRTGTIGFIAPMANQRFFADPNVAAVLGGIKEVLQDSPIQLVTLIVEDQQDQLKAARYVKGGHVDGVIVLTPELLEPLVVDIAGAGVPIAANGLVDGAPRMDSLVTDTRKGAGDMCTYLARAGVTRCAVIAGQRDVPSTWNMIAGIRDVFPGTSEDHITFGDHTPEAGRNRMHELLDRDLGFDGVFVASDVMASAALPVLIDRGFRVPDDVQLVGWDNSLPADTCRPSLTTMSIPFHGIGRSLASMLTDRINGAAGGRVTPVTTAIVRRGSSRPVRSPD